MKYNLHTHTTWSDGEHTPEQLVEEAAAAGITHLGITDHYLTAKLPAENAVQDVSRDDYVRSLRELAERVRARLQVYVGLEIDFCEERTDFRRLFGDSGKNYSWQQFDYVLFEYVNDEARRGSPLSALIEVRPRFSCPVLLAHNNLAKNFAEEGAERLVRLLKQADIGVELHATPWNPTEKEKTRYNLKRNPLPLQEPYYRITGSFNDTFYRLVREEGIPLSVGNDTHYIGRVDLALDNAMSFLREKGLEGNLILSRPRPTP